MNTTTDPAPRLWTRAEYHRFGELGFLRPDERVELICGRVLTKMSPQSDAHAYCIGRTAELLRSAFGPAYHVREEKPLVLDDLSEPEPDIVVVHGTWEETPHHPTPDNAVLVVEVSASSLLFDQTEKATAYAQSNIAEYWIINLINRQVEIRRNPAILSSGEYGYENLIILYGEAQISPLTPINHSIPVSAIFPRIVQI